MTRLCLLLPLLSLLRPIAAVSFIDAIAGYPELSNFTSLLRKYPEYSTPILNTTRNATILVPSNTAFLNYQKETGRSIETLDSEIIKRVLQYQTLNATVNAQDVTRPGGAVVGTQLVDKMYNDRGKWSESNAKSPGQVVYISTTLSGTVTARGLGIRDGVTTALVTSGDGATSTLRAVDGVWDGGRFQIIDHFLTLPTNCTNTMDNSGLGAVSDALVRTGKADSWNAYQGLTCLAPESAFVNNNDSIPTLSHLIDTHTIKSPQYTPQLTDGQTFNTAANTTITVSVRGGDVWFGDAKVIRANLIANKGVIHVLDKAITPNSTAPGSSSSPTSSSTAPTSTPTKKSLANPSANNLNIAALFAGFYIAFAFS